MRLPENPVLVPVGKSSGAFDQIQCVLGGDLAGSGNGFEKEPPAAFRVVDAQGCGLCPSGKSGLTGKGERAFKSGGFKLSALKVDFSLVLGKKGGEPFGFAEDPVEFKVGKKGGDGGGEDPGIDGSENRGSGDRSIGHPYGGDHGNGGVIPPSAISSLDDEIDESGVGRREKVKGKVSL